jgi:hypothetical protein
MTKGISPLISFVLTIMFGVIMVTLVLTVVNPTLDRAKDSAAVTETFQNLPLLDATIKEVASEAQGSKRTITISASRGRYIVNASKDFIGYEFDPNYLMGLTGTRASIRIEHGLQFFDYFNNYGATSDVAAEWTALSGTWSLDSYKYLGKGVAYKYIGGVQDYKFSASISNVSGTGGQVYISPAHPGQIMGFWPLDNRTGSKAYDYSGNGRNGTMVDMNSAGNSTSGWNTICKFGSCLLFDGINDYVNATVDGTALTSLSIEMWIKTAGAQSTKGIFQWSNSLSSATPFVLLQRINSTAVGWHVNGSLNINLTAADGTWYHLMLVHNGTDWTAYTDGALAGTYTGGRLNQSNALYAYLGNGYNGYFNGTIDEVKIWNKALTAAEVAAEYELSTKKLEGAGGTQGISSQTNATIVLVNPDGQSRFDDILINRVNDKVQTFLIPYTNVDISNTKSFGQGDHRLTVEHMGVNTTTNRPIIQIS